MLLGYQYGLFKLGVPGLLILAALAVVNFAGRRRGGHTPVSRALVLLLGFASGVVALIEGYVIFGVGMMIAAPLIAVFVALRRSHGGGPAQPGPA